MSELRTDRLRLRPYRKTDVDRLHRLWTLPEVRRYLWDDQVIPRGQAEETVLAGVEDWRRLGYGQWTVWTAESREFAGFCGFRPADWAAWPELLFGFSARFQGRGIAAEAAQAGLAFIFDSRGCNQVVAATDPPNEASVRLLNRLGMKLESRRIHRGLDTLFFALEATAKTDPAKSR